MALKAINAYDRARSKPVQPGSLQLVINGKPFGKSVTFDKTTKDAIELPDFAARLRPGQYRVGLKMQAGSDMPYSMAVNYHTKKPKSASQAALALATTLAKSKATEGEVVDLTVQLQVGAQAAPNPVAIIGIPAGMTVRTEQLKEWIDAGRIDAYEILGNDLVLYWRELAGKARLRLPIALVASIPGRYTAAASRSYLYYTDEIKVWVAGQAIEIVSRP